MLAVIDVGSNSVRLMLRENGKTLSKENTITALAEGMAFCGSLQKESIERTVFAIKNYVEKAKERGAESVNIFATEAVRSAQNQREFLSAVFDKTGINPDVLDGETEAKVGFLGAYTTGTCCVVDIGGASTEIIVGNKKKISYSKSVGIGVVKIKNVCAENPSLLAEYIGKKIDEYGEVPTADMIIAIGGTAGTIVSIVKKMKTYDADAVHNTILSRREIKSVVERLLSTPMTRRGEIVGLPQNRADVMVGGAMLLDEIMAKLGFNHCLVSESDNLEGYAKKFVEN